jgi:hypothetical protein
MHTSAGGMFVQVGSACLIIRSQVHRCSYEIDAITKMYKGPNLAVSEIIKLPLKIL